MRTLAKVDEQGREIRHQTTQMSQPVAHSKRRQVRDDHHQKVHERSMDLIHHELHFNFIKIHLVSHFSDHIGQFCNIPMYSSSLESSHRRNKSRTDGDDRIKSDAVRQIVHSYSPQHAIRMRLLNLKSLQRRRADLSVDALQHLESTTSGVTGPVVHRRILKGRWDDVSNVLDFSKVSGVSLESICP